MQRIVSSVVLRSVRVGRLQLTKCAGKNIQSNIRRTVIFQMGSSQTAQSISTGPRKLLTYSCGNGLLSKLYSNRFNIGT